MANKTSYSQSKRGQVRAQQQAAAARQKRQRLITVVVAVVVVVLGLGGFGLSQWIGNSKPLNTQDSQSPTVSTETSTPPTSVFIPPNGTAEMGYIEVRSPNAKPDALILNEHFDYQCPICKQGDDWYGATFRTLAERGDIVMRVHIRSFLDVNLKNDSSTRAAVASTCADVVGDFIAYHETVFAHQPAKEGDGYTDQQLRNDFPQEAGITGANLTTFQQCYDSRQTLGYVQNMERVNKTSRTINGADQDPPGGTPMYYVNGKPMTLSDIYNTKIDPTDVEGILGYLQSIAGPQPVGSTDPVLPAAGPR